MSLKYEPASEPLHRAWGLPIPIRGPPRVLRRARPSSHFTEMCSGSEAGSYLRLIDSCITQLKAQGPSRTCNESEEEEEEGLPIPIRGPPRVLRRARPAF